MKVSVITPTYNSQKTILDTVRSVLTQTHQDIEHIIVDNESTDRTIELIKNEYAGADSSRLKILRGKDRGISDAFNKGVKQSTGEIICILNSDDFFSSSQSIALVGQAFQDPSVDIVHGNIYFEDPEQGSNLRKPLQCPITEAMPFNHPAFFARQSVYRQVGPFKLDYRYAMDFEWTARLYDRNSNLKYKAHYLDGRPLSTMRGGGASHKNELLSIDEVERALKENGLWNAQAQKAVSARRRRIRLKGPLLKLRLGVFVKIWRAWKWGS